MNDKYIATLGWNGLIIPDKNGNPATIEFETADAMLMLQSWCDDFEAYSSTYSKVYGETSIEEITDKFNESKQLEGNKFVYQEVFKQIFIPSAGVTFYDIECAESDEDLEHMALNHHLRRRAAKREEMLKIVEQNAAKKQNEKRQKLEKKLYELGVNWNRDE